MQSKNVTNNAALEINLYAMVPVDIIYYIVVACLPREGHPFYVLVCTEWLKWLKESALGRNRKAAFSMCIGSLSTLRYAVKTCPRFKECLRIVARHGDYQNVLWAIESGVMPDQCIFKEFILKKDYLSVEQMLCWYRKLDNLPRLKAEILIIRTAISTNDHLLFEKIIGILWPRQEHRKEYYPMLYQQAHVHAAPRIQFYILYNACSEIEASGSYISKDTWEEVQRIRSLESVRQRKRALRKAYRDRDWGLRIKDTARKLALTKAADE
jgi:hypothetical protein